MKRATVDDTDAVAWIINHPSVRPHLGDEGNVWIDPSRLLEDEKNVLLFDDGGGQLFHWRGPGIFEAHSFYLVRGREALERGREAVRRMFAEYEAEKIWRATPVENRRARWFNRQLGFRSLGENRFPDPGYGSGQCELFEMRKTECQ
jgi:hypothetical protein